MNMRHLFLALALALPLALPVSVWASQCPIQMAQIDELLAKNPEVSAEELAEAKALRASGEAAHKAGNHDKAVADLAKAIEILDGE